MVANDASTLASDQSAFLDVNQLETSEEDEFGRYDDEHEQDAIRSASPSSLSFPSRRLCDSYAFQAC